MSDSADISCRTSWYSYALAVVSGLLIIETFLVAVYCVCVTRRRHSSWRQKGTNVGNINERNVKLISNDNVAYNVADCVDTVANARVANTTQVSQETMETLTQIRNTDNRPPNTTLAPAEQDVTRVGLGNSLVTQDTFNSKRVTPPVVKSVSVKGDIRPISTSIHHHDSSTSVVTKKGNAIRKNKGRSLTRTDPHHPKYRTDVIRNNTGSQKTNRSNTRNINKDTKTSQLVDSEHISNTGKTENQDAPSRGETHSSESSAIKTPTGIKTTYDENEDSGIFEYDTNVITDESEKRINTDTDKSERSMRVKKSVRFNLQEEDNKDGTTKKRQSNLFAISSNKHDGSIEDVGSRTNTVSNSFTGSMEVQATAHKRTSLQPDVVKSKPKFVVISGDEEEPMIVEKENKTSPRTVTFSSVGKTTAEITSPKDDVENNNDDTPLRTGEIKYSTSDVIDNVKSKMPVNFNEISTDAMLNVNKLLNKSTDLVNYQNMGKQDDHVLESIPVGLHQKTNSQVKEVIHHVDERENAFNESKQNIVRGHVNSLIRIFQKIDGGQDLSAEFNC